MVGRCKFGGAASRSFPGMRSAGKPHSQGCAVGCKHCFCHAPDSRGSSIPSVEPTCPATSAITWHSDAPKLLHTAASPCSSTGRELPSNSQHAPAPYMICLVWSCATGRQEQLTQCRTAAQEQPLRLQLPGRQRAWPPKPRCSASQSAAVPHTARGSRRGGPGTAAPLCPHPSTGLRTGPAVQGCLHWNQGLGRPCHPGSGATCRTSCLLHLQLQRGRSVLRLSRLQSALFGTEV